MDSVDVPVGKVNADRFWGYVLKSGSDECWEWQASTRSGYGAFKVAGRVYGAHRIALALAEGNGRGLVLHSCDNRLCCNPGHLRYGSYCDNVSDAVSRGRHSQPPRKSNVSDCDVARILEAKSRGLGWVRASRELGIPKYTVKMVLTSKYMKSRARGLPR